MIRDMWHVVEELNIFSNFSSLALTVTLKVAASEKKASITHTKKTTYFFQKNLKNNKMEEKACSHDKSGYCKFGEHCWKNHFKEICQSLSSCPKNKIAIRDTQDLVRDSHPRNSVGFKIVVHNLTMKSMISTIRIF